MTDPAPPPAPGPIGRLLRRLVRGDERALAAFRCHHGLGDANSPRHAELRLALFALLQAAAGLSPLPARAVVAAADSWLARLASPDPGGRDDLVLAGTGADAAVPTHADWGDDRGWLRLSDGTFVARLPAPPVASLRLDLTTALARLGDAA